jgi:hypothetical protein
MKRRLIFICLCLFVVAGAEPIRQNGSFGRAGLPADVRGEARKMAFAWVRCAKPGHSMDEMASRSIAFGGMVAGLYIDLDGRRMDASQTLVDSGLTILKNGTIDQDAAASRNTVAALMEIAEGRVFRRNSR